MTRLWRWLLSLLSMRRRRVVARDVLTPDPPVRLVYSRSLINCNICGKTMAAADGVPKSTMRCLRCGARLDAGRLP